MTSQPRPVWPTMLQRDLLADLLPELFLEDADQVRDLVAQWDAAPADAAEALRAAFICDDDIDAILPALGYPHTEQA